MAAEMIFDVDGTMRASWMVARNGTSGICGLTSNFGVNQHVSNVAISTIRYERGVSKDQPGLWVVVKVVK